MSERPPAASAADVTVPESTPDPAAVELPGFPDPGVPEAGRGTFPDLVRDCRRMAPKWAAAHAAAQAPVAPSSIHGTKVPEASSDVVARMPDYGS